jgi:hypothetical protein
VTLTLQAKDAAGTDLTSGGATVVFSNAAGPAPERSAPRPTMGPGPTPRPSRGGGRTATTIGRPSTGAP